MNILDEICPRAEHFGEERSAALLRQIVLSPEPRTRRRWRPRFVAAIVVGAIAAGSAAYAGGLVPSIVSDRFKQMNQGDDRWGRPISNERLIVDMTLSDGTPIRVWRADTAGGACQIVDTAGTQSRPEDFGVGCAVWDDGGDGESLELGGILQPCEGHPALVFGELRKPWLDVQAARVRAGGTEVSLPVDPNTHVFAGEISVGNEGDVVVIDYVNDSGKVLGSDHQTYEVDSDSRSCPQ